MVELKGAISAEDFVEKVPTERESLVRLKLRIRLATTRLNELLSDDFVKGDFPFLAYKILDHYGYEANELNKISIINAHKMAKSLVCEDLLWRELYNRDGTVSNFAEDLESSFDPSEFEVLPYDWSKTTAYLNKEIEGVWEDVDDYETIGIVDAFGEIDPAAEYASVFGRENIIALPFSVTIDTTYISIEHQEDFLPPYGGGVDYHRLIYLKKNRAGKMDLDED